MSYEVAITEVAEAQLRRLPIREQRIVEAAIMARLIVQPNVQTGAIKKLRPNPLAEYELRVGPMRILYNVEGMNVVILLVGRKVGNKLVVDGIEYHGHQDNDAGQP